MQIAIRALDPTCCHDAFSRKMGSWELGAGNCTSVHHVLSIPPPFTCFFLAAREQPRTSVIFEREMGLVVCFGVFSSLVLYACGSCVYLPTRGWTRSIRARRSGRETEARYGRQRSRSWSKPSDSYGDAVQSARDLKTVRRCHERTFQSTFQICVLLVSCLLVLLCWPLRLLLAVI